MTKRPPATVSDRQPDPYICSTCGRPFVVRILARDCEQRHEREAAERVR